MLNIFKKITLISHVFSKLETAKDVISQISKKPCFRTPLDSGDVKQCEEEHQRASIVLFHHFGKH